VPSRSGISKTKNKKEKKKKKEEEEKGGRLVVLFVLYVVLLYNNPCNRVALAGYIWDALDSIVTSVLYLDFLLTPI
jgi:hypothetical protein